MIKILFTGAGFSHNWGAPLGSEMWALIFNQRAIQDNHHLRDAMMKANNFNYEDVYVDVLDKCADEEKRIFSAALKQAYSLVDDIVKKPNKNISEKLRVFVKAFTLKNGSCDDFGCFFTLNQDLLIERICSAELNNYDWERPILYSGLSAFSSNELLEEINVKNFDSKAADNAFNQDGLPYIKLHGSSNWFFDKEKDSLLVVGNSKSKTEMIDQWPILKWNFEKFEEVLQKPGKKKMLIIGYGFRDLHINKVISEAKELELHILSPDEPRKFFENLEGIENRSDGVMDIQNKIRGYYTYALSICDYDTNLHSDHGFKQSNFWLNFQKNFFFKTK